MKHKVGIWIDHKRAVIVSASTTGITVRTLESDVGPHGHYSGRAEYPTPDGSQGGGEKRYEARHEQRLDYYYDQVISQLEQPEAFLIFGPGEAKRELAKHISRSKVLSGRKVGIETTDKLTEPQIVAKEHYGLDS